MGRSSWRKSRSHPAITAKASEALIQEVLGRGRPVDLGVLEVNPPARHLYERLGFRVTGESDAHHYMRAEP